MYINNNKNVKTINKNAIKQYFLNNINHEYKFILNMNVYHIKNNQYNKNNPKKTN